MKKLVILESPYKNVDPDEVERNVRYARQCLRDSLMRGECPIASHLLYTQVGVLDDNIPEEREQGIEAGLAWRAVAEKTVVYVGRGISGGMTRGIKAAEDALLEIEYRDLLYNWYED